MNYYISRLLNKWEKEKKIIIGIEYQDLIPSPQGKPNDAEIISLLRKCQDEGAYLVLFTVEPTDRYPNLLNQCKLRGLTISSINTNLIDLPVGSKVYVDILLDNHAGLSEAFNILEEALSIYTGEDNQIYIH
jgi:hypothetical protein